METVIEGKPSVMLGERVRQARLRLGLSQAELAQPQFTKSYISAIEHSKVRPSLKALEFLAQRLGVSSRELLSEEPPQNGSPDLVALEESLSLHLDRARRALDMGQAKEALILLDEAERLAGTAWNSARAYTRFRLYYLRGQAHLELDEPVAAQRELTQAATAAEQLNDGGEGSIRARNMLGLTYYRQDQLQLAVVEHEPCLKAIQSGVVKDLNLRLLIYTNLVKDYLALGELDAALGVYEEAVATGADAANLERQAELSWDLANVYRQMSAGERAQEYTSAAFRLVEAGQNMNLAVQLNISCASAMIERGQYAEAEKALLRARSAISGTANPGFLSAIYQRFADLELRQGHLEQADAYGRQALELIESAHEQWSTADNRLFDSASLRTYIEALVTAGRLSEKQGDIAVADRRLKYALSLAQEMGDDEAASMVARSFADLLTSRGKHEEAGEYYRQALNYPLPYRR